MGPTILKPDLSRIDFSDASCVVVNADRSLDIHYPSKGEKWVDFNNLYVKTEEIPNTPASGAVCYTEAQIQDLPGQFDGLAPIYHVMAMASVGIAIFGVVLLFLAVFNGLGRWR